MKRMTVFRLAMVLFLCMNLAVPPGLMAQGAKEETAKQEGPAFRPEEIDQMVAPIALYPDALLAQVLAASTYPLEIVQAARFVQQNKELKGEKLMAAAKDKDWDPSVKAMLSFPDVLLMMNEKLEWTEKLGNAFLGPAEGRHGIGPAAPAEGAGIGKPQDHEGTEGHCRERDESDRHRVGKPSGGVCPDVQPDRGIRGLAVPGLSAVPCLSLRLCGDGSLFLCRRCGYRSGMEWLWRLGLWLGEQ